MYPMLKSIKRKSAILKGRRHDNVNWYYLRKDEKNKGSLLEQEEPSVTLFLRD